MVVQCATEMGIEWSPIEQCWKSIRGQELLAGHGDATHALRPGVSFIPTIVLDGSQGNQKAILKNFLTEVCKAYKV